MQLAFEGGQGTEPPGFSQASRYAPFSWLLDPPAPIIVRASTMSWSWGGREAWVGRSTKWAEDETRGQVWDDGSPEKKGVMTREAQGSNKEAGKCRADRKGENGGWEGHLRDPEVSELAQSPHLYWGKLGTVPAWVPWRLGDYVSIPGSILSSTWSSFCCQINIFNILIGSCCSSANSWVAPERNGKAVKRGKEVLRWENGLYAHKCHIGRCVMKMYLWLRMLILIIWLKGGLCQVSPSSSSPYVINTCLVGWDSETA